MCTISVALYYTWFSTRMDVETELHAGTIPMLQCERVAGGVPELIENRTYRLVKTSMPSPPRKQLCNLVSVSRGCYHGHFLKVAVFTHNLRKLARGPSCCDPFITPPTLATNPWSLQWHRFWQVFSFWILLPKFHQHDVPGLNVRINCKSRCKPDRAFASFLILSFRAELLVTQCLNSACSWMLSFS